MECKFVIFMLYTFLADVTKVASQSPTTVSLLYHIHLLILLYA